MTWNQARKFSVSLLCAVSLFVMGCSSSAPGSVGPPPPPPPSGNNFATITVNGGPLASSGDPAQNTAYTSITICVPGSTTQCQTINNILVDTGSYGLRIQYSALTLSLPQQTDSSGNAIVECAEFGAGFTWGPVQTVDLTIGGETTSGADATTGPLPIQVMGSPNFPDTDTDADACVEDSVTGVDLDSVDVMLANGILGVGVFAQDCPACAISGASNPGLYYSCPTGSTCAATTEPVASQVVNPVILFPTDNNGDIVELPSVTSASPTLTGYLIFGIGTETDNALGSATVYGVDPGTGNFSTTFEGFTYDDEAFIDLGSPALYFNSSLSECEDVALYCEDPSVALQATAIGANNAQGTVNFSVGDADSLIDSGDDALNGIAGPTGGNIFDWGMPFFFGVNVYTAINGQNTPAGAGPYWAF